MSEEKATYNVKKILTPELFKKFITNLTDCITEIDELQFNLSNLQNSDNFKDVTFVNTSPEQDRINAKIIKFKGIYEGYWNSLQLIEKGRLEFLNPLNIFNDIH